MIILEIETTTIRTDRKLFSVTTSKDFSIFKHRVKTTEAVHQFIQDELTKYNLQMKIFSPPRGR